jgi:hypothetical protein
MKIEAVYPIRYDDHENRDIESLLRMRALFELTTIIPGQDVGVEVAK